MDKKLIGYAWTRQAIDTIGHVCLALDELVAERMRDYREILDARVEAKSV